MPFQLFLAVPINECVRAMVFSDFNPWGRSSRRRPHRNTLAGRHEHAGLARPREDAVIWEDFSSSARRPAVDIVGSNKVPFGCGPGARQDGAQGGKQRQHRAAGRRHGHGLDIISRGLHRED